MLISEAARKTPVFPYDLFSNNNEKLLYLYIPISIMAKIWATFLFDVVGGSLLDDGYKT